MNPQNYKNSTGTLEDAQDVWLSEIANMERDRNKIV